MFFHIATEMILMPVFESLFSGGWYGEVENVLNLRTTPFSGSDFVLWYTFCKFRLKILCCSISDFYYSSLFSKIFGKKIFITLGEIYCNK